MEGRLSTHIPQLRFKPTPFMAEKIYEIALREGRSAGVRDEHTDSRGTICATVTGE